MKKKHLLVLSVLSLLALAGCSSSQSSSSTSVDGTTYNTDISIEDPDDIDVSENTGEFSISTSDGTYSKSESVYTLTTAGTYTLTGKLEGQILAH